MITSFTVEEVIKGCLLKVTAQLEQVRAVYICVYAATNGVERIAVLNILCDVVKNCESDKFLFSGGDFNCTENTTLDRTQHESIC